MKIFAVLLSIGLYCGCTFGESPEDLEAENSRTNALYLPAVGDQEAICDSGTPLWNTFWESNWAGMWYPLETIIGQLAISLNGLHARGSCKDDYRSIILDTSPGTGPQYGYENTSGCALTVAGIWRSIGIADSEIWGTYNFGIDGKLRTIAERHFAYHDASSPAPDGEEMLKMGNVIGVGFNGGWNTHYFTVSTPPVWNPFTNRWEFNGINGGGTTWDGQQIIKNAPMSARLDGKNWQLSKYTWTNPLYNTWGAERPMTLWIATHKIPRSGHVHSPLPVDLHFPFTMLKKPQYEFIKRNPSAFEAAE